MPFSYSRGHLSGGGVTGSWVWGSDPCCLLPTPLRLTPAHSRKALRNSRIVSQKDYIHVCIMCLRAIMNYQVGQWAWGNRGPREPGLSSLGVA